MKFDNQFLTYEEYRFLGGKMDIMPFNLLEFEARKIINSRTQRRLENIEEIPQEVKLCVYKMVDIINGYINTTNVDTTSKTNGIASESIDGYSVSYVTADKILSSTQSIIKSKQTELEDIMMSYLINVVVNNEHVMYLGA